MVSQTDPDTGALKALREFLVDQELSLNGKLPPERQLCAEFGVTRGRLRKAMAVLEAEGQVWRHVGRGTFFGPRPVMKFRRERLFIESSP